MKDNIENQHPQDRLMRKLAIEDNWPLTKIGEHLGHVTKQRVSQRIHHLQITPIDPYRGRRPSPEKIVAICDHSYSVTESAKKLGISDTMLAKMLRDYELLSKYKTLWKEKKRRLLERRLIRIMQLIAKHLGRTPDIDTLNAIARESKGRIPYFTSWVNAFGSFRNAQIAADLTPNNRGRQHNKKAS